MIITYYWPPAGGSGVQRWLKFVKYLPQFGIEPIVYTVKNPNYPIEDHSLTSEVPEDVLVLRQPIWEPNTILNKRPNKKSAGFLDEKPSFTGKVLQYIRANYFIPDARKFWAKPSVRYLTDYLNSNSVDVIITTGPPHSLHLIGMRLKEELGIKWIADFRDPWTAIDYFHKLPLTKKSLKKHQMLEQKVLNRADAVITVGKTMAAQFEPFNRNIQVITNGFDKVPYGENVALDKNFSMVHIGMLNADRNPPELWEALQELCEQDGKFSSDLEIKLIGETAAEVKRDLGRFGLLEKTNFIPYVSHNEAIKYQAAARVLLILVNKVPFSKGIITGKIFEYLNANRPILAIGPPDGDLAEILTKTGAGSIVDFNQKDVLKKEILSLYHAYKRGKSGGANKNIGQYHRRNLTEALSETIKSITDNKPKNLA